MSNGKWKRSGSGFQTTISVSKKNDLLNKNGGQYVCLHGILMTNYGQNIHGQIYKYEHTTSQPPVDHHIDNYEYSLGSVWKNLK